MMMILLTTAMSTQEEKKLDSYKFPINDIESLYFRAVGAKVEKATLDVNDAILSIIIPEYPIGYDMKEPIDIKFFGNKPFHRALVQDCKVNVTLYTEEDIPSLMFGVCNESITWESIHKLTPESKNSFTEEVVAGSLNGPRTLKLHYSRNGCGYLST
jgi:hypothetical protein